MKQKILFLTFIVFSNLSIYAQDHRIWATYIGGEGSDNIRDLTTDKFDNIYLAGHTTSLTNISLNGNQNNYGGGVNDGFLVKMDSSGTPIWSTYFGGNAEEIAYKVATDLNGNVYIVGFTNSTSGISNNGFQNNYGGGYDGYLAKFSPTGSLLWSTYYGESGYDNVFGVATDLSGNVYIGGNTSSLSGISNNGFQNAYGGGTSDAFLVKFNSSGARLWATYYGGEDMEELTNISTDDKGNVYITGETASLTGIASDGFLNSGGAGFGFLVKFDSNGNRKWGTYYGGKGYSTKTDTDGNVYLAGTTTQNANIAYNGFQNTLNNSLETYRQDVYLVKFDSLCNRIWATYYGGEENDQSGFIALDNAGNVYLTGMTFSTTSIAYAGFQDTLAGTVNQFLVRFNSNGQRICATYYGQDYEQGGYVTLSSSGQIYLCAFTQSLTGIAYNGFQNFNAGYWDSYLAKFSPFAGFTGDEENIPAIELSVFPNPTNKFVTVEYNELKNYGVIYLEIISETGSVLRKQRLSPGGIEIIDVTDILEGYLIFKFSNEKGIKLGTKFVLVRH